MLDCRLVVLGHDSCGTVGAACTAAEHGKTPAGYIRDVVEHVAPSVLAAKAAGPGSARGKSDGAHRAPVDLILDCSRVVSESVARGKAAVVGLRYRLMDGRAVVVTTRGLEVPAT
ncbi:carbonic anhydrase [Streptomyces sp. NPDC059916]|uniref:carbonic anhydrase n=1 Tax=Streptomyces sp. NPDC059916 TaxID=3347001 RepID=UPI00367C3AB4